MRGSRGGLLLTRYEVIASVLSVSRALAAFADSLYFTHGDRDRIFMSTDGTPPADGTSKDLRAVEIGKVFPSV